MPSNAVTKLLLARRQLYTEQLENIKEFVEHFETGDNICEIQNRYDDMPRIKDDFERLSLEIIENKIEKESDYTPDYKDVTAFNSLWYKVRSQMQTFIAAAIVPQDQVSLNTNTQAEPHQKVRLPEISLPKFSGSYREWLPFYDAFNSLIQENKSLNNCQKFHYLKSCLKGEASRCIDSLTISDANYTSAWSLLQKRYKNERLIIQSHVQAIMNTPEISKASSDALRKLIDDIIANIEALKVLNIPVDSCDAFVNAIIYTKLDYNTKREFENTLGTTLPTRNELTDFLEKKCIMLESMQQEGKNNKPYTNNTIYKPVKQQQPSTHHKVVHQVISAKLVCRFCKQRHVITKCQEFLALSVPARRSQIEKRKLCINCFRDNHQASECKAMTPCKICGKNSHHTLLHQDNSAPPEVVPSTSQSPEAQSNSFTLNACLQKFEPNVILSTAVVLVRDSEENWLECRCLLDVGSQLNLLSENMVKRLGLKANAVKMSIWGVSGTCNRISESVDVEIKSVHSPFSTKIRCYVTDCVTVDLPTASFEASKFQVPNVCLADPQFNIRSPVDLILNAEIFWSIICTERIKLAEPNLFLSETLLGWIVGGAYGQNRNNARFTCNKAVSIDRSDDEEIKDLMERFWKQEELPGINQRWSTEDINCEKQFLETFQYDSSDGRFVIKLPFKDGNIKLGDSLKPALRRFISLESKFRKSPEFKRIYSDSFLDLIKSGIIEEVPEEEIQKDSVFFLPHSGVFKKTAETAKLRIVYDGSAKSSNGLSLNDILMTGPNLQNDLFDILIRFRTHQVVMSCDMEKMFLQIKVDQSHRDFQRILWRNSEDEEIKQYRITRLVFGLTNSPYTAMRCVRQIADECFEKHPEVSNTLKNDIFMDDILSGANEVRATVTLRDNLISVLNRHGFSLAKWASNDKHVLPSTSETSSAVMNPAVTLDFENPDRAKVLGLWWKPNADTLTFRVNKPMIPDKLTKRMILSSIAKLYDPLGLISPVIIKAKIIMQSLWSLGLGWDDEVPASIKSAWEKYLLELDLLNNVEVRRKIIPTPECENELIAFCDASLKAYGTAIYLRCKDREGKIKTSLLCAKTRVSPTKVLTLPRLELCAAVLAATLMDKVSRVLNIKIHKKYFFSDSTIVLHYIKSEANLWQIFVANRIAQIQNLSDSSDWYHVETALNPADLLSRGAFVKDFINYDLYWHGPEYLLKDVQEWPLKSLSPSEDLPEKRKVALTVISNAESIDLTRFSSFLKIQRVFAYVLRVVKNARSNDNVRYVDKHLSVKELTQAHDVIIKMIQRQEFKTEIDNLQKGQNCLNTSRILRLDPFLDNSGILRVGGRLRNISSLPYSHRHPIILPAKHHVTKLLIIKEHLSLLHAGPSQTLASLRTKYWPLRAKNEIKKIIHSCIRCFRVAPKMLQQKMGDLPKDRIEPCRPFLKIGVDYLGPIYLKEGNKRSKRSVKVWVALFVCLVTRAVHLELVSDMTSECFVNSLKRLIARRGYVSVIYCDNAKTFVGAKAECKEFFKFLQSDRTRSELDPFLSQYNISWHFIPPKAPNFGGIWERLVKSVKFHFKRVTTNALLTFEEASTLLSQIEAVVNSRPLTALSNDITDYEALTPAHFLIGESLMNIPERDLKDIQLNRLNHWQRIQKMKQLFWKRFYGEVVSQMQQRPKWHQKAEKTLKIGDLVLIHEESPPLVWKIGRIMELFPGPDGLPRVASVRTNQGIYKRSIRHLAPLPIEEEDSEREKSEVRE